jgi:hypothetical protein
MEMKKMPESKVGSLINLNEVNFDNFLPIIMHNMNVLVENHTHMMNCVNVLMHNQTVLMDHVSSKSSQEELLYAYESSIKLTLHAFEGLASCFKQQETIEENEKTFDNNNCKAYCRLTNYVENEIKNCESNNTVCVKE